MEEINKFYLYLKDQRNLATKNKDMNKLNKISDTLDLLNDYINKND